MQKHLIIKECKANGLNVGNYIGYIYRGAYGGTYGGRIIEYIAGKTRNEIIGRLKARVEEINDETIYYRVEVIGQTRLRELKSQYGEKRQRTGGHGYTGGDGMKEID